MGARRAGRDGRRAARRRPDPDQHQPRQPQRLAERAETGALCQAYTLDKRVTASVCVSKLPGAEGHPVLAPCGVCQERLALWGPDVEVAVADADSPSGWSARTLRELNPFYWGTLFSADGGWPSAAEHLA
ncbi:hypothetical protein ACH347_42730 [Saccharopolyspora sp. 5N102]|uniref:hypothetical protein n=1 Tax=Saccharopolyspora sp. 5N102 TaxID=3375155 RepID=UPI00379A8750